MKILLFRKIRKSFSFSSMLHFFMCDKRFVADA